MGLGPRQRTCLGKILYGGQYNSLQVLIIRNEESKHIHEDVPALCLANIFTGNRSRYKNME